MRRMLSTRDRFQKRIASPSLASSSSVRRRAASTRCSPLWPRFPATFRRPIVVAQHLDPRRQSHLGEILSSRSVLPVRTVSGDQPLEPGVVYVIAADRDVEISDHALTVTAPTGTNSSPRPSVDRLLATAARTFADELVAVILTGTGSDGATGAQAVKAHGGTVIVQNPDTATYPGMPLAVPSSAIDIVADLEAIGPLLGTSSAAPTAFPPQVTTKTCTHSSTASASGRGSISPPTSERLSCAGCNGAWRRPVPQHCRTTGATWNGTPRSCNAWSRAS